MADRTAAAPKARTKSIKRYNKYGYIFLIPFAAAFIIFQLIPLVQTVYNSFFENYKSGLKMIGPNFIGLDNYKTLFASGDFLIYFKNTMIMWVMGFIPQMAEGTAVLQDSDLSAESYHGIRFCHALLHPVR